MLQRLALALVVLLLSSGCGKNQDGTAVYQDPSYNNPSYDQNYQVMLREQNARAMQAEEAAELDAVRGGHIGGRR